MDIAVQTYLPDSGYRLPPSSCHIKEPNDHWLRVLSHYTREQLLFRCPGDKRKAFVNWDRPLAEQKEARYSSFSVNGLLDPIHYRYGPRSNRYNCVNNIRRPMSCIWINFRVLDSLEDGDRYEPSEAFTIVFNAEPLAGDLAVNGRIDPSDLFRLSRHWLAVESSRRNDYCERADADRDGAVNLFDFARMAANWRMTSTD